MPVHSVEAAHCHSACTTPNWQDERGPRSPARIQHSFPATGSTYAMTWTAALPPRLSTRCMAAAVYGVRVPAGCAYPSVTLPSSRHEPQLQKAGGIEGVVHAKYCHACREVQLELAELERPEARCRSLQKDAEQM